ncbi:zinc-dependent alcohol dehydrogenase [Halomonas sp. V046]|uniref:zinc-dependent alcohol dehydrogenase n=1 Tax=Halomonas sp. V046 TaxID=3459611 RepID=UPI0040445058
MASSRHTTLGARDPSGEEALATAFWTLPGAKGEVRSQPLAAAGAGDVRVEAWFSGISRGTESLVFRGQVPPSERERMRAPFQAGEFGAAVKYGYASVGRVIGGESALVGRTVFCLYPHQDRYVVPATAVVAVPEGVPPRRAVLAANMETAVNALWDARPAVGDRIQVIGGGVIGLLVAYLCARLPGTEVCLVDVDPTRRRVVEDLGARFCLPEQAVGECDLVFHTSGQPAGLVQALELAGNEATVIEMSWYGTHDVTLALGQAFHSRRLTLKASQVGHILAERRVRWDYPRRLALALSLLADERLDALLEPSWSLQDMPERMAALADGRLKALCQTVRYASAPGVA